ncbi:unnamed protein product [Orchesella dallaii]|uniref:Peptidase S1 domain-containing protein n=1 Tax=Orchesella dallaii TaxID=48710 RepID=A0ABP1Q6D5_9HEXA
MKNLLLVSIGILAFFGKSARSTIHCVGDQCLPADQGCDTFYDSHKITLPDETKTSDCTGKHGAGKLVYCCKTQYDATQMREEMAKTNELKSMKNLARSIAGAETNEYPHQVQFRTGGWCGGTVYNKNWIITAAHCVRHGNDTTTYTSATGQYIQESTGQVKQAIIIAGLSNIAHPPEANQYTIDKVIWHEKWNPDPAKVYDGHDIALLHLSRPLALEKGKIQPMKLAPANFIPNYGGNGVFVGFGNVHTKLGGGSEDLMEFIAPIHHPATGIEISFNPLNSGPAGYETTDMQIAIGGGESGALVGQGDSGGPFICADDNNKPILCGIASYKTCDVFVFCKKPSYFQRVAPLLDWIKNNTNSERQEEELIFDEPLFPEKVENKKVPKSLVRIVHVDKSCMGVIVTPKMILTTADCVTNPGYSKARPIVYHFESEMSMGYAGTQTSPNYQSNVSQNVSHYLEKPFNRNDMGIFILETPVTADYVAKLAPMDYQMKGRSVEYTFNKAVGSVEKRNFMELDKEECNTKLRSLDRNLELTPDQLCMRRVYSAEKDCKRDLGGMLLCDNEQYLCGIGSFHACKASGFPEIFSNYLNGRGTLRRSLNDGMAQFP